MWKKEYAERRKAKYHSEPGERERRLAQSRSGEENKQYMQKYYEENKDRYKEYRKGYADKKNEQRRERYANDPEFREKCKEFSRRRDKYSKRNGRLLAEFGIDAASYDAMLAEQNGRCAICGSEFSDSRQHRLHVDHDHTTGKVRGLLCASCNLGIGKFKDDPELLQRAIEYLIKAKQA